MSYLSLHALSHDPLVVGSGSGDLIGGLSPAWRRIGEPMQTMTVPILFVHGELDPVSPIANARRACERLPQAELAEFSGARHDVVNEIAHSQVADMIARWTLDHAR